MEAAIDVNALAAYLAQKTPEEGPGSEKRKKEFDEQARTFRSLQRSERNDGWHPTNMRCFTLCCEVQPVL